MTQMPWYEWIFTVMMAALGIIYIPISYAGGAPASIVFMCFYAAWAHYRISELEYKYGEL